jgi:alpha-L-fucosidase
MVRTLQPDIILNDRMDLKEYEDGWDFTTPEQFKVTAWPEVNGKKVPWETCQTFSGSWGYYRDEHTWKDTRQLLVLLIESVSKGGNLLLNVGPTGRGTFDHRAQAALASMGEWMKVNSRSIYGCTQAPEEFEIPDNCLLTYNPDTKRLYIHLLDYPLQNFRLPGYRGKVKYAQFLHDASEIRITEPHGYWIEQEVGKDDINLSLPVIKPNVEIPVIEVFLEDY